MQKADGQSRIVKLLGISPERVTYNYEILAMYFIRDSLDAAPRLLFPTFILITLMASFSLIVIIHNSFAVSMNEDSYICVLGRDDATLEELNALQREMNRIVAETHTVKSENRIQEQVANDKQIRGMMILFGGFCVLLAIIGIANIFSNTLGFVRQRKREFARYLSVGMTPEEIFMLAILGTVALAYYMGWRNVRKINLAEVLRDETLM